MASISIFNASELKPEQRQAAETRLHDVLERRAEIVRDIPEGEIEKVLDEALEESRRSPASPRGRPGCNGLDC